MTSQLRESDAMRYAKSNDQKTVNLSHSALRCMQHGWAEPAIAIKLMIRVQTVPCADSSDTGR